MSGDWAKGRPVTDRILVLPPAGRLAEVRASQGRLSAYLSGKFPGFVFEISDKPLDDDFNLFPICSSANADGHSFTLLAPPDPFVVKEMVSAVRAFDLERSGLS